MSDEELDSSTLEATIHDPSHHLAPASTLEDPFEQQGNPRACSTAAAAEAAEAPLVLAYQPRHRALPPPSPSTESSSEEEESGDGESDGSRTPAPTYSSRGEDHHDDGWLYTTEDTTPSDFPELIEHLPEGPTTVAEPEAVAESSISSDPEISSPLREPSPRSPQHAPRSPPSRKRGRPLSKSQPSTAGPPPPLPPRPPPPQSPQSPQPPSPSPPSPLQLQSTAADLTSSYVPSGGDSTTLGFESPSPACSTQIGKVLTKPGNEDAHAARPGTPPPPPPSSVESTTIDCGGTSPAGTAVTAAPSPAARANGTDQGTFENANTALNSSRDPAAPPGTPPTPTEASSARISGGGGGGGGGGASTRDRADLDSLRGGHPLPRTGGPTRDRGRSSTLPVKRPRVPDQPSASQTAEANLNALCPATPPLRSSDASGGTATPLDASSSASAARGESGTRETACSTNTVSAAVSPPGTVVAAAAATSSPPMAMATRSAHSSPAATLSAYSPARDVLAPRASPSSTPSLSAGVPQELPPTPKNGSPSHGLGPGEGNVGSTRRIRGHAKKLTRTSPPDTDEGDGSLDYGGDGGEAGKAAREGVHRRTRSHRIQATLTSSPVNGEGGGSDSTLGEDDSHNNSTAENRALQSNGSLANDNTGSGTTRSPRQTRRRAETEKKTSPTATQDCGGSLGRDRGSEGSGIVGCEIANATREKNSASPKGRARACGGGGGTASEDVGIARRTPGQGKNTTRASPSVVDKKGGGGGDHGGDAGDGREGDGGSTRRLRAQAKKKLKERNDGAALAHGDGTERRTVRSARRVGGEANGPERLAPVVAEEGGGGVGGKDGSAMDEDVVTRHAETGDDASVPKGTRRAQRQRRGTGRRSVGVTRQARAQAKTSRQPTDASENVSGDDGGGVVDDHGCVDTGGRVGDKDDPHPMEEEEEEEDEADDTLRREQAQARGQGSDRATNAGNKRRLLDQADSSHGKRSRQKSSPAVGEGIGAGSLDDSGDGGCSAMVGDGAPTSGEGGVPLRQDIDAVKGRGSEKRSVGGKRPSQELGKKSKRAKKTMMQTRPAINEEGDGGDSSDDGDSDGGGVCRRDRNAEGGGGSGEKDYCIATRAQHLPVPPSQRREGYLAPTRGMESVSAGSTRELRGQGRPSTRNAPSDAGIDGCRGGGAGGGSGSDSTGKAGDTCTTREEDLALVLELHKEREGLSAVRKRMRQEIVALQYEEDELRRSLGLPAARSMPVPPPPRPQPSSPPTRRPVRPVVAAAAATKEPGASAELPSSRVLPAALPLRSISTTPDRTTAPERPPAPTPQSGKKLPPPRAAAQHPASPKEGGTAAAQKSNEMVDSPTLLSGGSSDDGGLGCLLLPESPTGSAGDAANGLSDASDGEDDGFDLDKMLMSGGASDGHGAGGGGGGSGDGGGGGSGGGGFSLVPPQPASLAQRSAAGNGARRGPESGDRRVGDLRGRGRGVVVRGRGGRGTGKGGLRGRGATTPRGGATGRRHGGEAGSKGVPAAASLSKSNTKKRTTNYTQLGQGVAVKFRGGSGNSRPGKR